MRGSKKETRFDTERSATMSRCKADIPLGAINPRIYRDPLPLLQAEIKFHRNRGGACDIFLAVMRNRLRRGFDTGHHMCTRRNKPTASPKVNHRRYFARMTRIRSNISFDIPPIDDGYYWRDRTRNDNNILQ